MLASDRLFCFGGEGRRLWAFIGVGWKRDRPWIEKESSRGTLERKGGSRRFDNRHNIRTTRVQNVVEGFTKAL
jgi:hypothetical protein